LTLRRSACAGYSPVIAHVAQRVLAHGARLRLRLQPLERLCACEQLAVALMAQQHEDQVALARFVERTTGAFAGLVHQRLPQLGRRTLA
jgi:hypothetical protein